MRPTTPFEPPGCPEELQELLEPFLDGELDASSTARIESHLVTCLVCSAQLEEARRVREALRSLPLAECPSRVVDAVMATATAEPLRPRGGWRRLSRQPTLWLAAASVLLAVLAGSFVLDRSRPTSSPAPPLAQQLSAPEEARAAEVAQAEQDVRLALALFAQVGDRVGRIVRDDVIAHRVSSAPSLALEAIRERTEVSQ